MSLDDRTKYGNYNFLAEDEDDEPILNTPVAAKELKQEETDAPKEEINDEIEQKTTAKAESPVTIANKEYEIQYVDYNQIILDDSLNQNRTHAEEAIQIIANSIYDMQRIIHPITIYVTDETKDEPIRKRSYNIINGNRRVRAWKLLNESDEYRWSKKKIPCFIVEKPASKVDEVEMQLESQITRGTASEQTHEIRIAAENWDRIRGKDTELTPEEVKKFKSTKRLLKERFIKRKEKEMSKLSDEAKKQYIYDNYSPKYEYIRAMTGITDSNTNLKNLLNRVLHETGDGENNAIPNELGKRDRVVTSNERKLATKTHNEGINFCADLEKVFLFKTKDGANYISGKDKEDLEFAITIIRDIIPRYLQPRVGSPGSAKKFEMVQTEEDIKEEENKVEPELESELENLDTTAVTEVPVQNQQVQAVVGSDDQALDYSDSENN